MEKTNKPSIEDVVAHNLDILWRSAGRVTYSGNRPGSTYAIVSRETGEILFVDSTITHRKGLGVNPTIEINYPQPRTIGGRVTYALGEGEEELTPQAKTALDRSFLDYNF